MNVDERFHLIKQVGEEIITEEELKKLLEEKKHPVAYDGFEPSGKIHIAQAVLRAITINKMLKAGCRFKMLVADWHAWANNKMGGDLDKIRVAGQYMAEVWKASGMDTENVEFVYDYQLKERGDYWKTVMKVARSATLKRLLRCSQIMGRKEDEALQGSQIIYPCMQAADIFELKADITQLGMDQRKVNVLAREIGPSLGYWKPVVVSHHMLLGLGKPVSGTTDAVERAIELKMSKSKPDSCIFVHDTEEEIRRKITKAYCPEKQEEENPVLEYAKYLVFERVKEVTIERKFGEPLYFSSYAELVKSYKEGQIHPMDLKAAVAHHVDDLVKPIREHFEKNAKAGKLLEEVKSFEITR